MGAEQLFERLGLGLAELREAHRGVADRAVMLTQLRAGIRGQCRRRVPLASQCIGEETESLRLVVRRHHSCTVTRDKLTGSLACELTDGLLADGALDVLEGRHGEVVVVHVEGVASRVGQGEHPCGPAATACRLRAEGTLLVGLNESLCHQRIEVAAHHRRAVPQPQGKLRRRGWPAVQEGPGHALSRRTREFHTLSVSQILRGASRAPGEARLAPLRDTAAMDAARLEQVVVAYPGADPGSSRGLRGLDLEVAEGRVTALLGPNGAGKSTTVGVITGLIDTQSGSVRVLGGSPGRLQAREWVNVMVQDDGLPTGAHAAELVRHVARLRGAQGSAEALIRAWGLDEFGRTTIRRLSGGERRRVSLACALVGDPRMVILDEPTSGLDPRGRSMVWETITRLRERGCTVLLCTHHLDEAEALADDVAIISAGRCVVQGPLADIAAGAVEAVTFDGPLHLDLASLLRALPEGTRARESFPGRYRIEGGASPQMLATVASWCAQHGVQPRNLGIGGGGLADAYWQATELDGDAT